MSSEKLFPARELRKESASPIAQAGFLEIAWAFTVILYFLEYAVRSCPSVMIPELEGSFHTTALGISAILGVYYDTYSSVSLIAGVALDHPQFKP